MILPSLPGSPPGVRYALTVPQSVLFADISLRGSRPPAFEQVFGSEFELDYVVIDDGAMSWDFTGDERFARALFGETDPTICVRRFVAAMGATARAVEKASWLLSSSAIRRPESVEDLLADLREYWAVYERHMTSLFTFWNVEELLSEALTQMLREHDLHSAIQSGLERFLVPGEANYFALERRSLERIRCRFLSGDSQALDSALRRHVSDFGFLLAPFNLGKPPSVDSLRERLEQDPALARTVGLIDARPDMLSDIPEPIRELGLLAQELTFWKTERLDVMSLADSRAADLYRSAAAALELKTDQLFAMRRHEIDASLSEGKPVIDAEELANRISGYCLLLHDGEIGFFEPSRRPVESASQGAATGASGELRGTPASRGVVSGKVRLIMDPVESSALEVGEILVTTMTRPEMGVALDRAAAFVTDEGGRMAHAAIIAREMGKPCVIGTGEATRILRDGMSVTVDGDNGLVIVNKEGAS